MSEKICLTVLIENSVHTRGLKAEHGLAWHIQFGLSPVLFDAGQTDLLLENAGQLGLSLDNLDAIVLSHGHYDHTGGLAAVCAQSPRARGVDANGGVTHAVAAEADLFIPKPHTAEALHQALAELLAGT